MSPNLAPSPARWPRPPAAIPHHWLTRPPGGARVTVAGLVMVRQRPGTAKGVIFITLEDETGIANVVAGARPTSATAAPWWRGVRSG